MPELNKQSNCLLKQGLDRSDVNMPDSLFTPGSVKMLVVVRVVGYVGSAVTNESLKDVESTLVHRTQATSVSAKS